MLKWIIQSNLGDRSGTVDKLVAFVEQQGYQYEWIKVIPFSDEPPDVSTDGLTVFYGSTTLIKNVAEANKWKPGVWFNNAAYEFNSIIGGFGKDNILNGDSLITTIDLFLNQNHSENELFFLRPAADMKEFAGGLFTFKEAKEQWKGLKDSSGPLTYETLIQVATPKNIVAEYRTIVVDKTVVAASQYKKDERPYLDSNVPNKIIDFANEMAQGYQPCEVFTLDVCELPNGKFKVVEPNTFNCSGLYWCDHHAIVKSVSEFVLSRYG